MATQKFEIRGELPPPLSVAQTARKYKIPAKAFAQIKTFLAGIHSAKASANGTVTRTPLAGAGRKKSSRSSASLSRGRKKR